MAPNVNQNNTNNNSNHNKTEGEKKKSATRNAFWKLNGNKVDPNLKSKLELPAQNTHSYIYHICSYTYTHIYIYMCVYLVFTLCICRDFSHTDFSSSAKIYLFMPRPTAL